jgi:RNA-directed DNA polymerase
MKRVGYLMAPIADPDNLRLAFWKAQRGKAARSSVQAYRAHLDTNLHALREQLLSGQVQVGDYHYFRIYDPKERLICSAAFSERVLHHALMNVCHPYFERVQIYDSYASRSGKGTYAALDRASQFTRQYRWFLKLDVRKYFNSLAHEVILSQLGHLFKDPTLLNIFHQIIASYQSEPGFGMPIGNLTSQYIANHYLVCSDHYVQEVLKAPAYVRYMDDMVIWHHDKQALQRIGQAFEAYLNQQLRLILKPHSINQSQHGLPFLGYLVYPNRIWLAHRSRIRFSRKLAASLTNYETGIWSEQMLHRHLLPLISFTDKAQALGFRRRVLVARGERDEPCFARGQLEQQPAEHAGGESEQQQPLESEQQHRLPPCLPAHQLGWMSTC